MKLRFQNDKKCRVGEERGEGNQVDKLKGTMESPAQEGGSISADKRKLKAIKTPHFICQTSFFAFRMEKVINFLRLKEIKSNQNASFHLPNMFFCFSDGKGGQFPPVKGN